MKTTHIIAILTTVTLVTILSGGFVFASANIGNADGTGNPDAGDGVPNNYGGLRSGSGMTNKMEGFTQRKFQAKEKLSKRNSGAVDGLMNAFHNKYKNMPQEQVRVKYEALVGKMDAARERIQNLNISEAKKEAYMNLFDYIQVQVDEILENTEEE